MASAEKGWRRPDGRGRIGLIAGGGSLPAELARRLCERGEEPFVLAIAGEVPECSAIPTNECRTIALEEIGEVIGLLKKAGVSRIVLAGTIGRRPRLRDIRWSWGLIAMLPRLVPALKRGDDGALRAVIAHLEAHGIAVVGAHELVPDLLAEAGVLTRVRPRPEDRQDIAAARAAARAIGALDIGQAAIAIGGRAVALEGIEGTDGLLERMETLRGHGRIAGQVRGVLAKFAKPIQELRADLPAIGPATVEGAARARLAGIVVEAGRSLILERERTIDAADRLGLFILALEPGEDPR
jgi:DUF1009 family protein